MQPIFSKRTAYQALSLGGALLWGIVELIALQRARVGFSRRPLDTSSRCRVATNS
jgi:hypothetical protein